MTKTRAINMLVIVVSLLFASNVHSDQPNIPPQNPSELKLLILGDSLSAAYGLSIEQGWVNLLSEKWLHDNNNITVVNAAISGDTTDGGLARLPRLLRLHQPSHLYIELGGNNALQGHNPTKIKQNLIEIIELAQENDVQVIIQEMQIPTNYGARYTKLFNSIFHDLAAQYEIPLIPFFLEDIAFQPNMMQRDGIHPTKAAQPLIVEFISSKLLAVLRG